MSKEETQSPQSSSPTSNPTTPTILTKDFPATTKTQHPTVNAYRCNSNVSNISTSSSVNSSGHGSLHETKSTKESITNDLNLSSDLASLLYSFNGVIEQSMYNNHNNNLIMRSASSAGETVTKYNPDLIAHLSVPKRAETFNGISKDSQIDLVNLNSELISKSRNYKNSIDLTDVKPYLLNDGSNKQQINSTSLSAESGLCSDLNQDIIDIGSNCSSSSLEQLNEYKQTNATKMNKSQMENILRFVLNDYVRLRSENETLHKELEMKNKSIDLLRNTMDECKDQLNFEKISLQKKFNELDRKEVCVFDNFKQ